MLTQRYAVSMLYGYFLDGIPLIIVYTLSDASCEAATENISRSNSIYLFLGPHRALLISRSKVGKRSAAWPRSQLPLARPCPHDKSILSFCNKQTLFGHILHHSVVSGSPSSSCHSTAMMTSPGSDLVQASLTASPEQSNFEPCFTVPSPFFLFPRSGCGEAEITSALLHV